MLDNFVTLEGSPNVSRGGKAIGVTLGTNRTFPIGRPTRGRMGGGPGTAVELAFDAVDPQDRHSPVRAPANRTRSASPGAPAGTHRVVYAGAFLTHFNIHPAHTVLFETTCSSPRGQDHDPRPRERDAGGERK